MAQSQGSAIQDGARSSRSTVSRVAARVAERYAQAPSYREVLAANAAAAAEMASAAAAVAEAHQAAHKMFASLAERDLRGETGETGPSAEHWLASGESASPRYEGQATVEHPHPLPPRAILPARCAPAAPAIVDAFAEAEVPPAMNLPAKLIEFPRELIASRKARPRIAEGPLAEAPPLEELASEPPALRIFEVQGSVGAGGEPFPGEFATAVVDDPRPAPSRRSQEESRAPQWQSILLGEHPSAADSNMREEPLRVQARQPEAQPAMPLHVAALTDRGMAALVDLAVVTAAFLLFVLVFAACTAHPPLDKMALTCAGVLFAALVVFYQWLFLSYGGGTLGMRYAQVALCTFSDDNPTRPMLRRRLWASLLAALPLGIGLLWAIFDEDALGWHDRMSQTYQRSYR